MRRPGRLIFLLALSPRRRLEDALKTLLSTTYKFIVLRYIATIVKGYKNIFTHVFYDCDGI
jgi:hypothetical protein